MSYLKIYFAAMLVTFLSSLVIWFQASGVKSYTGLLGVALVVAIGYILSQKQPDSPKEPEIQKLAESMRKLEADNQRLLENYLDLRDQISVLKIAVGVKPSNKQA